MIVRHFLPACLVATLLSGVAQAWDTADLDLRNVRSSLEDDPKYQWTPLFWAVRKGNLEEAKQQVRRGENLGARDFLGRTPLHIAAMFGHLDVVNYLIEQGADVNARDQWRATPLQRLNLLKTVRGWDRSAIQDVLRRHGGVE